MRSVTRRTQSAKDTRRREAYDALLTGIQQALLEGATLNQLSVGELANRSGISRSRFYAHFRDKGDFLCTWLDNVRDELNTASAAWTDLGPAPTFEELHAALSEGVATYQSHALMLSALLDAAVYDELVHAQLSGIVDQNIAALTRHIQRGQRQGWIDRELLAAQTAAWLIWMTERAQNRILKGASELETERHVNAFCHVVWHALYASPSAAS
ncbi:TetR/AcrR family transcriptional regulator [Nocardia sp. R16R-3T]